MTLDETIECLKYIADSPPQEHGGFDELTVKIAKSALKHLEERKDWKSPEEVNKLQLDSYHVGYKQGIQSLREFV